MLNINIDPLEQFLILNFLYIPNISIIAFLTVVMILGYQYLFLTKIMFTEHNNYKTISRVLYIIVKNTVYGNINMKKQIYFPLFFCLFILILINNILGLVPFTFTATSSFIVAFYYASTLFIIVIFLAIYYNGWKIVNLFLPEGVPLIIAPGIINIEIISFLARIFSLSIRLFANMMSGHALMKILNGFSWSLATSSKIILAILAIIPWIIVTIVMFLESLIAFLQAYVFLTLGTIYINDVISSH